MIINLLNPKAEATIEFDYSRIKQIPNNSGCYVISNFNYEILYIGKAKNLKNRFNQHIENPKKTNLTKLGKAYWYSYKICSDEYEISRLERGWLNCHELVEGELPLLNKIHAG